MFDELDKTISFISPAFGGGSISVGGVVNFAANVAIIIAFFLSIVALAVSLNKTCNKYR